jgi:hypothetical protein
MDLEVKNFKNMKGEIAEGIFIDNRLLYSLSGFAQVRRGLIAHTKELGDGLGWLYVVLILLAKPIGKDKGTLEISLKVLSRIMGKSLSQITRNLNNLAKHKNRYIIYQKAKGRYSRLAKIIIPKYPVDKSVDSSSYLCEDSEVHCIDAKVKGDTNTKNGEVTCMDAEVELANQNKIKKIHPSDNILITEKTKKSLITADDHICGRLLFVITLRALKDLNPNIESEGLKTIISSHCNIRDARGWCYDPEQCYLQVYSVIEKISQYEVNDYLEYFKTSLENFLNENAEALSQKVKKEIYAQKEKEDF